MLTDSSIAPITLDPIKFLDELPVTLINAGLNPIEAAASVAYYGKPILATMFLAGVGDDATERTDVPTETSKIAVQRASDIWETWKARGLDRAIELLKDYRDRR